MPRMENNGGDRLARGAASHTFRPMGERKTREEWDKIFEGEPEPVIKAVYILTCPVHGTNKTTRECFVSGGFPLLDEKLAVKCKIDDCTEVAVYAGHEIISGDASDQSGVSGPVVGEDIVEPVAIPPDCDIPF